MKNSLKVSCNNEQLFLQMQMMRSDLEQKQDVLNALVADLSKVQQCSEQTDQGHYRCTINLSQYAEHVNQLSDRWKRILLQINSRSLTLDEGIFCFFRPQWLLLFAHGDVVSQVG